MTCCGPGGHVSNTSGSAGVELMRTCLILLSVPRVPGAHQLARIIRVGMDRWQDLFTVCAKAVITLININTSAFDCCQLDCSMNTPSYTLYLKKKFFLHIIILLPLKVQECVTLICTWNQSTALLSQTLKIWANYYYYYYYLPKHKDVKYAFDQSSKTNMKAITVNLHKGLERKLLIMTEY